jgi:hypothetical protein
MSVSASEYFNILKTGFTKKINKEIDSVRRKPLNQPKKVLGKPLSFNQSQTPLNPPKKVLGQPISLNKPVSWNRPKGF